MAESPRDALPASPRPDSVETDLGETARPGVAKSTEVPAHVLGLPLRCWLCVTWQ